MAAVLTTSRDLAKKIVEHPFWLLLVGVATVVAAVVPFLVIDGEHRDSSGSGSNSAQADPQTNSGSNANSADPPTNTATMPLPDAQCIAEDDSLVSCDASHEAEIYTRGSACSFDTLLRYLGGSPSVDVLLSSVVSARRSVRNQPACIVLGPSGLRTGSAEDVLLTAAGDAWRRCQDGRSDQTVSCAMPHTSEYVFAGKPTDDADCDNRASRYLNADVANFADQIKVQQATSSTAVACVVTVRGRELLTASVRRIGAGALPLQPQ